MPKPWNNWASTFFLLQVLLLHRLVFPCAWAVCYDLHLTGLIADYCCHYKFNNIHTHTYHVDMAPQCAVSFSILNDPYSMATFLLEFSMTFFMQTHLRFLDFFLYITANLMRIACYMQWFKWPRELDWQLFVCYSLAEPVDIRPSKGVSIEYLVVLWTFGSKRSDGLGKRALKISRWTVIISLGFPINPYNIWCPCHS